MNRSIHFMNFVRKAGLAVLMTFFTSALYAQVTGLNYSLSPTAERVIWSDISGLSNGYIYGGKVGIGFGQYIELEGIYQFGRDFTTAPNRISQNPDFSAQLSELPVRDLEINKYGLNTKLNLSSRAIVPYLNIGAGVIEFRQDNHTNSRQLYYSGGAGLMTTIASRYSIFAEVNRTGYRLNSADLYTENDLTNAGLAPSSFSEILYHSWNAKLGLKVYLGGSRFDDPSQTSFVFLDRYNGGLFNTRISITPTYGQIFFDESLGMPSTQHIAGLTAGLEFGPHVTIQGFYWSGFETEDSFSRDGLTMYGAELKSSLFRSNITPYLTLGAGYLSMDDEYIAAHSPLIDNQIFGLAGVGMDFHISNRVTIDSSLRTMMNSVNNPEPDSWTQDFKFSSMFTAGVTIKIGSLSGRRAYERRQHYSQISEDPVRRPEVIAEKTEPKPEPVTKAEEPDTKKEDIAVDQKPTLTVTEEKPSTTEEKTVIVNELPTELQLAVMREAAITEQIARAVVEGDTAKADFLKSEREMIRSQLMGVGVQKPIEREVEVRTAPERDTRTFTLPVLEEGEIYIRFGTPEPRQKPRRPVVSEPVEAPSDEETRTQELEDTISALLDQYLHKESTPDVSDTAEAKLQEMELRLNRLMEALESRPGSDQNIDARFESFEQKVLELLQGQAAPTIQENQQDLDARFDEFERRMLNILELQGAQDEEREVVSREVQTRTVSGGLTRETQGRDLQGLSVYTGVSSPLQMLIGVRADYGTILGNRLQMAPEFTFGFGSSTTMYNINMNMLYNIRSLPLEESLNPYVGLGVGIMAFTSPPDNLNGIQLTGSILLGMEFQTNNGAFFVDYANFNLFKVNRLQAGYRFYF